jgi:hypothetical protein
MYLVFQKKFETLYAVDLFMPPVPVQEELYTDPLTFYHELIKAPFQLSGNVGP